MASPTAESILFLQIILVTILILLFLQFLGWVMLFLYRWWNGKLRDDNHDGVPDTLNQAAITLTNLVNQMEKVQKTI